MIHEVAARPDVTLDLTGLSCPGPILGAKKVIAELAQGQVLLLISDCPATHDDLYAWAAHTRNQIVRSERRSDGATGYYVRRGRPTEPTPNVALDLRGFLCPGPVVEARRVLQRMPSGQLLKLTSDCPGALDDLTDWARVTGATLERTVHVGAHEWEFYVRKP
jgi:tRNA 2-thiouridine synthesizing protein A